MIDHHTKYFCLLYSLSRHLFDWLKNTPLNYVMFALLFCIAVAITLLILTYFHMKITWKRDLRIGFLSARVIWVVKNLKSWSFTKLIKKIRRFLTLKIDFDPQNSTTEVTLHTTWLQGLFLVLKENPRQDDSSKLFIAF